MKNITLSELEFHPDYAHLYIPRGPYGGRENEARRFIAIYLSQGKDPEEASRLARARTYLDVKPWSNPNSATPT